VFRCFINDFLVCYSKGANIVSQSKTSYKLPPPEFVESDQSLQSNEEDNCLVCRLMQIQKDKADIIKWVCSSSKSSNEKADLASTMTGLEIDEELIEYLADPSIQRFVFSD
jgi:hypothetical protein